MYQKGSPVADRTVYGNTHSENGWRMVDQGTCRWVTVPGTSVRLQIREGQPEKILAAFAADYNAYVEPLRQADSACWTATNSVATSNHLSGTAMDLNWNGPDGKTFRFQISETQAYPPPKNQRVRELLDFYEGMVYCGGFWSIRDWMHFQMGYNTYGSQNVDKVNDFIRRKIRADGFSTFHRGANVDPDAFPLPAGYYYGPLEGPNESISGRVANTPQAWKDGLGRWQSALGLPVTKVWDDATRDAATKLQHEKKWPPLEVDLGNGPVKIHGCVFKGEWDAVIREGWRLAPPPPPAPKPVRVGPADDQLVMRFNCLGKQTLVEAVAEIRDHLLGTEDRNKPGVVVE